MANFSHKFFGLVSPGFQAPPKKNSHPKVSAFLSNFSFALPVPEEIHPKIKSSSEQVLNNFRWVLDSCHREEGKVRADFSKKSVFNRGVLLVFRKFGWASVESKQKPGFGECTLVFGTGEHPKVPSFRFLANSRQNHPCAWESYPCTNASLTGNF